MTFKTMTSFVVTLACGLLMVTSCSTLDVYHRSGKKIGHGPPAHARAHGHRRKQVAGVQLVYDSGCGVYVVVGLPNHYYYDGYFYRISGTVWEVSLKPDGGWASLSGRSLPPGLQAKAKGSAKAKGKYNKAS